jgi:hypothetical protein
MDYNFPFEASSAHYCLGWVVDTIINILQVVKMDDLFPICFPVDSITESDRSTFYKYSYNLTLFKDTLAPLYVPWHTSKWNNFSSRPNYLSLMWDFENCSITLAELKCKKYLTKLNNFLLLNSSSHILKKDALSLLGALSHITIVHYYT